MFNHGASARYVQYVGSSDREKVFQELKDYLKSHCLPDGHLSHGLQVYLNLLKSETHQPKGENEYKMFAKNVVDQVVSDYTKPAQWPTLVRFMHKTNRPDINKAFDGYKALLWDSLTPGERKEGEYIMKKYANEN